MIAVSRVNLPNSPLPVFLTLNEIDRRRPSDHRLTPATVKLLADKFGKYNEQYPVLAEFPELTNASIARFVAIIEAVDKISDHNVRSNTMGIYQSNLGIWQILARQG